MGDTSKKISAVQIPGVTSHLPTLVRGMRQPKNRSSKDKISPSGRLRIVAGKWRSRLLPVVDEAGLRPTPARVRETVFNWLADSIEGRRCLDLYAGSGALGFEALSRGAAHVVFVEHSSEAAKMLRENISLLEATGAVVHQTDALKFIESADGENFDVVFLDPPFADDLLEDLCRLLAGSNALATGATVYLEQRRDQTPPALPAGWVELKEKSAGKVRYALVQVKDSTE